MNKKVNDSKQVNESTSDNVAIIKCPKCNNNLNAANKRCPKCGTLLPAKKVVDVKDKIIHPTTCPACGEKVLKNDKFCSNCGTNVEVVRDIINAKEGIVFNKSDYNEALFSSTYKAAYSYIKREVNNNPDYKNKSVVSIENKMLLMTGIFSIIYFILITLYVAFHISFLFIIVLLAIIVWLYCDLLRKNNVIGYLTKQVQLRPDEKINYVVSSIMTTSMPRKKYTVLRIFILLITFILSITIYARPYYIYERVDNGYNLRYYTIGLLKKEKVINIPEKHKNLEVVGIRGDVFKGLKSIEEVVVPNTVTEIRGGAFKGCTNLRKVTLSNKLVEIHGGTFMDCKRLSQITIPETVKNIGGEAFMNCYDLNIINLPSGLTEIHGSTFENCYSLDNIIIPEGVTRIGGSAFRQCTSLRNVIVPRSVTEIGSSAFRGTAIDNVCIPESAYVNERAFKETYAKISYYENDCEYRDPYNYIYNYDFGTINFYGDDAANAEQ